MTKRQFNKEINALAVNGRLSVGKMQALPKETKTRLVHHIVSHRGPVVVDLIPKGEEMDQWLSCCGYLHTTKGAQSGFTFRHTGEHLIR